MRSSPPPKYNSVSLHDESSVYRPRFTSHGQPAHIDFSKYAISGSKLSRDRTTRTIYSQELTSDPVALEASIREHVQLPPLPLIRIQQPAVNYPWVHTSYQAPRDLKFNFMSLLVGNQASSPERVRLLVDIERDSLGGLQELQHPHLIEESVTGWCRKFSEDAALHKRSVVSRIVSKV